MRCWRVEASITSLAYKLLTGRGRELDGSVRMHIEHGATEFEAPASEADLI